ncbi:family 43 glycosylhydrolase [Rhizosphaericola mali]|uniref:Family 43 glycosylhydrolase n=1 Tax=Rhizosphaericola mali TaxID=2545455 RepID=A0A5P2FZH6_9BACT|nr:family 43 glycosylhydrolase [Rhizosphaericola mali]QES87808.1 family 43 glycosylhydrolase [Rhizosphaericola mali]
MKHNKAIAFILFVLFTFIKKDNFAQNKDNTSAYLFVYFTGNAVTDESIHFGLSWDGYHYRALNKNEPILQSNLISETGGVRDPHILRSQDGRTFYMVVTDMTSNKGWNSNRGLTLLKSEDLIHWTSSVINIQKRFKNQDSLLRVWAPQTIYDPYAKKYMVYFSMKHGIGPDIIYYIYANNSFTDFEGEPKQLFYSPTNKSCIDGDIIYAKGLYHLFFKTEDETIKGLKIATSKFPNKDYVLDDKYVQQTDKPVEGAGVFPLNNNKGFILMYDMYSSGKYQFTYTKDLKNFKVVDQDVTMDFHPRHGTILPITKSEADRLIKKWGDSSFYYSSRNPVLKGFYADPDIIYSHQTDSFYLYPTSDGFKNWSGVYFQTFASKDLRHWKDDGKILELGKDVSWANRNAWAPTIAEKKIGNKYKYYFYYTAAQKIGVAESDHPNGPFKDLGKPLISEFPDGIHNGQIIDPAVFHDPISGKYFIYYGNGWMACAELNDDMTSIKENSTKIITPDKSFREGSYVIYRKEKYYFFWSVDDTRSPDYQVRYGYSNSPYGPITIPENNTILSKDTTIGILGTGHNSIIQIPGKDEWYIVYHRFKFPDGQKMGDEAGYNREVCIDALYFDKDGKILRVPPTTKGIDPVKL